MDKENYCKKLSFKHPEDELKLVYGLITDEDDFFITFKTRNGVYRFNKSYVISIRDTDIVFSEKKEGYDYENEYKY